MSTPVMKQYSRFKKQHENAILLFRMGDFYEMFYDDAKVASKILGIALTSRSKGEGAVPMAGVPYHAVDSYIQRLIKAGYRVAICDQIQDASEAKGIVDRDVTRIITPGTLTDDTMLDEKSNNYLLSLCVNSRDVGLSWVDLSTGKFETEDIDIEQLYDELARLNPSECILPENLVNSEDDDSISSELRETFNIMITSQPDWVFGRDNAYRTLLDHFQTSSLDGFGCGDLELSISSAGAIIHYLRETQKTSLKHINKIEKFSRNECLVLDRTTQRSLELTQTMRDGQRGGTLLWVLDKTLTPMGGRLLRSWITAPLTDVTKIRYRQQGIKELVDNAKLRETLQRQLREIYDIERIATNISCGRANARNLIALKHSLSALPKLKEASANCESKILKSLIQNLDTLEDIRVIIGTAIVPDPPTTIREGGIIREGYSQELDEVRNIKRDATKWIANFQAREIERTGITSLKVGYNKVFGYYIEVTNVHSDKIPQDYMRKQTLKNAERYITPQLKEYETRVLTADERAGEMEYKIFIEIRDQVAAQTARIQAVADIIAQLDVLLSLAAAAVENNYVMPQVDDGLEINIVEGRHPVLEVTLEDEPFVPNDTKLDSQENLIAIITGPNMSGKSVGIRQAALLVLMAQMGSFVPAKYAKIGVVDRIFTRVGASDELARGQSTFMIEMNEAANILNNATRRSLVILDEIGRGTSTFDGVSIAWAIAEYIHEHVKARTLFATHYHELTELALLFPGVKNYNVAVREWEDEIIFLHKIVEGGTDKSYGIHVARLAGIPKKVIERAKVILSNLECATLDINDKPKFATPQKQPKVKKIQQLSLFAQPENSVVDDILRLDIENLTPIEALKKLEEFKKKLKAD